MNGWVGEGGNGLYIILVGEKVNRLWRHAFSLTRK